MTGPNRATRIEEYRPPHPPPASFSRAQIDYIDAIEAFLRDDDLRRVRAIERFGMNLDFGTLIAVEIPGFRPSAESLVVYVKRFSAEPYFDMARRFLDLAMDGSYGRDVRQYVMRPYRVTLPNGDRYYPFAVGTDPEAWRRKFRTAVETLGTASAEFDRGLFVVTREDPAFGEVYTFGTLRVEVAEPDELGDW